MIYLLSIIIGAFVGIISLGITDIAFSVSSNPVGKLLAGVLFIFILAIAFITGGKKALACLLVLFFPFIKVTFLKTSFLTLYVFILILPFRKEILDYFSNMRNNYVLPFLAILLAMIFTALASRYPLATVSQFVFICSLGVCYSVLSAFMKSYREVRLFIQLFFAVLAFCVLVSFLQYAFGIDFIKFSFYDFNLNVGLQETVKRVPSVFWEAQSAGQYFAVAAILCLGAWQSYFKGAKWLPFLAIAATVALLLTISRTAILAFVLSIVVVQLLTLSLKKAISLVMIVLLLLAFGAVLYQNVLSPSMKERFGRRDTATTWEQRYKLWTESLPIILNNPLGVGLGGENLYAAGVKHGAYYISEFNKYKESEKSTHFENSFLQVLYSLGVPGLLGFLALMAKYFALGLGLFRRKDGTQESAIAIFLVGAMIAWLICLFTSPLILEPQSMFVFIVLLALMNSTVATHSREHIAQMILK